MSWEKINRSIDIKAGLHKRAIRQMAERAGVVIDAMLGPMPLTIFTVEGLRDFGFNVLENYLDGRVAVLNPPGFPVGVSRLDGALEFPRQRSFSFERNVIDSFEPPPADGIRMS